MSKESFEQSDIGARYHSVGNHRRLYFEALRNLDESERRLRRAVKKAAIREIKRQFPEEEPKYGLDWQLITQSGLYAKDWRPYIQLQNLGDFRLCKEGGWLQLFNRGDGFKFHRTRTGPYSIKEAKRRVALVESAVRIRCVIMKFPAEKDVDD